MFRHIVTTFVKIIFDLVFLNESGQKVIIWFTFYTIFYKMDSITNIGNIPTVSTNVDIENTSEDTDMNSIEINSVSSEDFGSEIENESLDDHCLFDDLEENDEVFNDATEFFEESNYFIPQNRADLSTLHPHTNCTLYDAFLMIFAYSKRHKLTWEATEDLARLMNRIIGEEKIPPSKHIFKKKFQSYNCTPVKHFTCNECNLYLGTLSELKDSQINYCPNCSAIIELNTKYKKNHFLTIPFQSHMQQILHQNSEYLSFNSQSANNDICDVHDGLYFQNLRKTAGNTPYITLTFSTDGASVFKATKDKSAWPLQFIINEIDLKYRFKRENVFCAAISFGKTPNMSFFLKPFIEEITRINNEGGLPFEAKNGETINVMIYPMILTCDILAKQYVLNKASFHGYKGCSYCLHDGTLINNRVRYCNKDNVPLRTNGTVRADMLHAQMSGEKINGYKGVSALMALEYFDVVWQPTIDKMHNIDMGITKKLFDIFLDNKNKK